MKKPLLTDFDISLNELYNQEKQIWVSIENYPHIFAVTLKNALGEYDCQITSFEAGISFKTKTGTSKQKYSTLTILQNSIIRGLKNYVDFKGEVSFSLSDCILQ